MATYKVTNQETGKSKMVEAFGWDDPKLTSFDGKVDDEGYPLYEVELECDHYDSRVCQSLGHGGN